MMTSIFYLLSFKHKNITFRIVKTNTDYWHWSYHIPDNEWYAEGITPTQYLACARARESIDEYFKDSSRIHRA